MKKSILFTVISIFIVIDGFSQAINPVVEERFTDAEFFFLSGSFNEALVQYNFVIKRGLDNGNINYRIGLCYLNIPGFAEKAIPFFEKAIKKTSSKYDEGSIKEVNAPKEAFYYLGKTYRIIGKYESAIANFEKYKQEVANANPLVTKFAENEIVSCKEAPIVVNHPIDVKIANLGKPICTTAKDYVPAVSENETVIAYNSSQKFYEAVMVCRKNKGVWSAPQNITPQIISDGNQFVSSISADGRKLILRKEDGDNAELYMSVYEKNKWTESVALKGINTKYAERNASLTKDGNTIYFSSNRKGTTGGLDIYRSQKDAKGKWAKAENLGTVINTEFEEDCPVISEDGSKLYFISQGHKSIGGFDVFYCNIAADGTFSEPVNVGYPINTSDDESYFYPIQNGKIAYYSKFLTNGMGNEDIIRAEFLKAPQTSTVPVTKQDSAKQASVLLMHN
jgi:tetratricopeptide (TPR) repeat protein